MMSVTAEEALIALFADGPISPRVIFFSMNEDDVRYALKQPFVSVGSDAGAPTREPRAENTAVAPARLRHLPPRPRPLRRATRNSSRSKKRCARSPRRPPLRANLHDRGVLRAGMKADSSSSIPPRSATASTFEDPHHFSEGVSDVIVNGVPVLRDGAMTEALPADAGRSRK